MLSVKFKYIKMYKFYLIFSEIFVFFSIYLTTEKQDTFYSFIRHKKHVFSFSFLV